MSRNSKSSNVFLNVAIFIISLIMFFAIGEIYFRLFRPQQIVPRYVESGSYGIRKNIANVRGEMITHEYRHKFSTNSQGFRGLKEYSFRKNKDVFRIVVLGDSVTLGHGVEDHDTFSALLEKRLSTERSSEVLNMGVSGFGTGEELIQLEKVGLKYNPDLVILAYFPNDPYNNIVSKLYKVVNGKLLKDQNSFVPAIFIRDHLNSIPGYSFLSQRSHLINFLRNSLSYYFITKLAEESNLDPSTSPKKLTEKEATLTVALIEQMYKELNKNNIPLIVLNIPVLQLGEVYSNFPDELINSQVNSVVVDVNKQIFDGYAPNDLYYIVDCHPKPLGHQLIAEWLETYIKRNLWANLQTE